MSNLPLVAAQDGDGDWQQLNGDHGRYTFSVASGRYGLAYVCASGGGGTQAVMTIIDLFSVDEKPTRKIGCHVASGGYDVNGLVAGLNGEKATVSFVNKVAAIDGDYSVQNVPGGTWDFVAARATDYMKPVDRVIVHRDVVVDRDLNHDFDFGNEGAAPEARAVSVIGADLDDQGGASTSFAPNRGGMDIDLPSDPGTLLFIPESMIQGNDIHRITAQTQSPGSGKTRQSIHFQRLSGDEVLILPPKIAALVDSIPGSAPPRYRMSFESTAASTAFQFMFSCADIPAGLFQNSSVQVGAGWLGKPGPQTIDFPLLWSLPGWDPSWSPLDGIKTIYVAYEFRSNRFEDLFRMYLDFSNDLLEPNPPGLEGLEIQRSATQAAFLP